MEKAELADIGLGIGFGVNVFWRFGGSQGDVLEGHREAVLEASGECRNVMKRAGIEEV